MHYVSTTCFLQEALSSKDGDALYALRKEANLKPLCGYADVRSPCGWRQDFEGPKLSFAEQELLMVERIF